MRRPIRSVVLLSAVALWFPDCSFAEQPPGRIAAASTAPITVARSSQAPDISSMSARRGKVAPSIETRDEAYKGPSGETHGNSDMKRDCGADIEAMVDEGAFLLPTWNRGFWAMPPGGLTRFLIPPRGFINPEQTLPPGASGVSSG